MDAPKRCSCFREARIDPEYLKILEIQAERWRFLESRAVYNHYSRDSQNRFAGFIPWHTFSEPGRTFAVAVDNARRTNAP